MKFSAALATLALGGTALALPAAELEARQNSGSYTISGLGARKKQITAAGADSFDLAIAMLESERMTADYAYGDNKQQDSANFGIFKQNWGLLRECCSRFRGQPQSNWNNGAVLKYVGDPASCSSITCCLSAHQRNSSNLNADVQCLNECQSYYGLDRWVAGHRNGATGLANPNTQDIQSK